MNLLRPLGPVETAIWLLDRAGTVNFTVANEIVGPLSEPVLRQALAAAQARHPLLRAAIAPWNDRAAFVAPSPTPEIPLRTVANPDAASWHAECEREIQVPIPWHTAPLVRAVWIRHGAERSTLLLTFHHVIGDGFSGAYLARDVLGACGAIAEGRDPALPPLPIPGALETHLPTFARGWRGLIAALGEGARHAWTYLRMGGRPAALSPEARVPLAQRRGGIVPLRFQPETTAALRERCRAERTTLHGALGAALTLAVRDELPASRRGPLVNFGSPVNLRERMVPPVADDVGLFVSLADAIVRVHAADDFWALARGIRDGTAASVARGAPFVLVPVLGNLTRVPGLFPLNETGVRRVGAFVDRALGGDATTGLTNLGALTIARTAGPLRIDAIHFAVSPSAMGRLLATAASLQDVLCVNVIHSMPWVSRQRAQRVAETMRRHVEAAAAGR